MDRFSASVCMFGTALRAGFIYHLSVFVLDEVLMLFSWLYRSYQRRYQIREIEDRHVNRTRKHSNGITTFRSFSNRSLKNGIICLLAILSEALGASIGTLLYPGYGTLVCDRLGANVAYILWLVCSFIARGRKNK